MEKTCKKRGRPRKDGAKREFLAVRLDENEVDILEEMRVRTGLSKSEIIRKALKTSYNLSKYQE